MQIYLYFLAENRCYLHNCATVTSGECIAGGVRSYTKYLIFLIYDGKYSHKSEHYPYYYEKSPDQ